MKSTGKNSSGKGGFPIHSKPLGFRH